MVNRSVPTQFDQRIRQALVRGQEDIRRAIEYVNDDVVPGVRRRGAVALRAGATEFERWARRMEAGQSAHASSRMREDARRWTTPRRLAWLAAVIVAALTGCHKHAKQQAAQTAPPPLKSSATDRRAVRPVHLGSGNGHTQVKGEAGAEGSSAGTAAGTLPGRPGSVVSGRALSTEVGLASWYGPPYAGRKGADGTVYDQNAMTAAHLTLPLGTVVRVTNLVSNQSVVVRVTDRGPFVRGRIIDLSLAAAKESGVYRAGVVKVRVEAFSAPPLRPNTPPGGRWCVQVGAFVTEADALQEKADLARRYPKAKVLEFAGPTGYWVRINPKSGDKRYASDVVDSIHLPDAAQPYLIRTD